MKGETLCFYEEFDDMLYGWPHNNSNRIITHLGDPSNYKLQGERVYCLFLLLLLLLLFCVIFLFYLVFDFMFFNILWDILRDVIFVLDKGIHHGNLRRKNVVIKEGRAKLICISNDHHIGGLIDFTNFMKSILAKERVQFRIRDFDDFLSLLEGSHFSR